MVTHWESSKRPLYIKTIWKDGHHHVLLNHNQTPKQLRKTTLKQLVISRPVKSAPHSNLNVSSVKILKTEDNVTKKSKMRPRFKPHSPKTPNIKETPLTIKSNTLDIDIKEKYSNKKEETSLNLTHFEKPQVNSLTERVLIWLDLATHNEKYSNYITLSPPIGNISAPPALKKRQLFAKQRCFSSYHANCDYEVSKFTFQVEGTAQALQIASNVKNHNKTFEEEEVVESIEIKNEESIVSSRLEENVMPENILIPDKPVIKSGMKRQLHIFLPNLQKKHGFCDSDLSSQLSTCSLLKNDNSREI